MSGGHFPLTQKTSWACTGSAEDGDWVEIGFWVPQRSPISPRQELATANHELCSESGDGEHGWEHTGQLCSPVSNPGGLTQGTR